MNIMQLLALYPWVFSLAVGLPVGIVVAVGLYQLRSNLGRWLRSAWGAMFTRAGFFWGVSLVFMAVSVLHAGIFFGITGQAHDVPGVGSFIGFAVSFFLDLVTIILMQALLEARYRGDTGRYRQLLSFIFICCGTSTFANLAISLNDFDPQVFLPRAPIWVQVASPYVLASFPLFVIMMAIASELIINVRPLDKLKEDEYEADEIKRIRILEIRNEYFNKQVDTEIALQRIKAKQRTSRDGHIWRWPWSKPVDINVLVQDAVKPFETVIKELQAENGRLAQYINSSLPGLVTQVQALQQRDETALVAAVTSQLEENKQSTLKLGVDLSALVTQVQALPALTDQLEEGKQATLRLNVELLALAEQVQELQSSSVVEIVEQDDSASTVEDELVKDMRALLGGYPGLLQWIDSGQRSASEVEIVEVTGHTPKMISNRVKDSFAKTNRTGVYRLSSVVKWLKNAPLPAKSNRDTTGGLEALTVKSNGHSKAGVELVRGI